jgi:hypothetical protein
MNLNFIDEMINEYFKSAKNVSGHESLKRLGVDLSFKILALPQNCQEMAWELVAQCFPKEDSEEIGARDYILEGARQVVCNDEQLKSLVDGITELNISIQVFNNSLTEMEKMENQNKDMKEAIKQMKVLQSELIFRKESTVFYVKEGVPN